MSRLNLNEAVEAEMSVQSGKKVIRSPNPEFLRLLVLKGLMNEEGLQRLRKKYEEDAFGILMHLVHKNAHGKDVLGRLWGDSINIAYVNPKSVLL